MDNLRGLLGIKEIEIMPNVRVRRKRVVRRVDVDERMDEKCSAVVWKYCKYGKQ